MQIVLIISVFTLTTAATVPTNWQLSSLDRTGDLFVEETRPVLHGETFPRAAAPGYTANAISGKQNQITRLPVNNVQWVPIIPTSNPYTFLTPPIKVANENSNSQNNPDLVRALNNFFNIQSNVPDVNGVTKKANIQQGLSQEIQHDQRNINSNPVFHHNQVQFIPYSTQDINSQGIGNSQSLNVKQTHPQLNSQNTASPFIDLDFNLNNPFGPFHQGNRAQQKYVRRKPDFNTNQPEVNFDLNFNAHFPHNHPVISNANQHNTQIPQIPLPPVNLKNTQIPNRLKATQSLANLDFDPNNPFYKNYRDDPQYDREPIPKAERLKGEKAPISMHEYPAEVPTKPIYPGEGQWAKFGVKHKPYIGHHKFTALEESKTVPEGYDTFLEAHKLFDHQNNQFGKKLLEFPQKHQLGTSLPSQVPRYEPLKFKVNRNQYGPNEEEEEEERREEENKKDTFTPTRLYAQVRHSDEEKHLPSAADENGKLKELVKDTKVHTIYSEEGYEDSAYDHAGHEKNAENAEDYEKDKKHVEKMEERSKPVKKYHLPKEEDIDTQEDLQNLKREILNLDDDDDDAETSSTQHSKAYVSKEKPPKKVYSAKTKDASKYKAKKHDFMESTGSNPVATIVKGDGNTEIEISSEVKLIVQPNNVTKAHKFVKIYPKFHTEDILNKNLDGKILKTTSTEIPFTTITPTKFEDIFPVEIPATTQATTAIPKIRTPLPNGSRRRRKRFANYFPKIEVDTDFIDKINHTLPEKKDLTKEKYPYYHDYKKIGLHEGSPLRYAEDLTKIPVKTDGTLAFYEQADRKKKCSEVDQVVDPVPDRIKKADKKPEEVDGSTDVAELAESPRLTQLGDKIDCFKARYFGENPFDNPLFKEKVVGPVKPIFEEFDSSTKQKISKAHSKEGISSENLNKKNSKRDLTSKRDAENQENDIESDALEKNYKNFIKNDLYTHSVPLKFESGETNNDNSPEDTDSHEDEEVPDVELNSEEAAKELNNNDITEESQVHTLPPATLITTPKYTISLKPKHIYDQIELLQYLPIDEYLDRTTETVKEIISTHKPDVKVLENTTSTEENNFDNTSKSKTGETITNKVDNDKITERVTETIDRVIDKADRSDKENKDINENKYISKLEEIVEKTVPNEFEYSTELTSEKSKIARDKAEKKDKHYLEKLSEEGTQKTFTREPQESVSERRTARVLNFPEGVANKENSGESLPEAESLIGRVRTKGIIKKPFEIFDINDYLPKIALPQPPFTDIILTQPIHPKVNIPQEQTFEVFDVNKYLPTPYPIVTQSTVLPKYKVVSEVFYKDDIKPNEQLNVFTDVFNNIKNSPQQQQDVIHDASEQISVKLKVNELNNKNLKNAYMTSTASTTTTRPTRYRNQQKNNRLHNSPNSAKKRITGRRPYDETDNRTKRWQTTTIKPNMLDNLHKNHQMYDNQKPVKEEESLNVHDNADEQKIQTTTIKAAIEPIQIEQEESTKIMGLVPPDPHIYKTIYHPKRDNTLDLSNDGLVEERKLNKYIVRGMKPPPRQRVYDYSDYLTLNHIRYTPGKSKRSKRSATRPAYAEVSRNRDKQEETNTEKDINKDDDDYVPHRTRNYHYDEKTGKIVYDKKPEEKEESEEVEYIEVVEEPPPSTTSKPKQNPIFATATPPPEGKSYVDFVKLLKSAINYHEIPDPTTTEKEKESTTEAVSTTTLKPVSTTPPEFLSILAKVRNDSNYKFIEEKRKTKTTTTVKPIEEEEDVEQSGESQFENVKNSPGSPGVVGGENFKLFDITDFLPNVKNYMPKTAIDTSKYKSIERPTTRRNHEEKVKETSQDKVVNPATRTSRRGGLTTTTEAPVTSRPTRSLARKRTTTSSSILTTQESVTDTPKHGNGGETVQHDRARRTYRRRNPRIKSTPTATSTEKYLTENVDNTTKIILRRSQRDSSVLMLNIDNHNKETSEDFVDQSKPLNRVDEQGTYGEKLDKNVDDKNAGPVVQQVVEIFKNYDKTKRHGGNFREEDEVASENRLGQSQQNKILPYEGKKEDVEVFKKYDKTKKHGGNYKAEYDGDAQSTEKQTANIEDENDKSNIEVFKNYDKSKKHGGNYKSEDEIQHISEPLYEESRVVTPTRNQIDTNGKKAKDVEVFKDYDKNKKHGGNYMHENDFLRKQKGQTISKPEDVDKAKDVEIFNNYDKTKKHGGNYRPESEAILDPHNEETSYGNPKLPQKRDQKNREGQPLPLAILKPESFYTDPKLPVVINGLNIVNGMSPEELEEIVASAEAESASDDFEDGSDKDEKEDRKDEVNIAVVVPENNPPEVSTTTTKPLFIKDPGKRLYYYAPLR